MTSPLPVSDATVADMSTANVTSVPAATLRKASGSGVVEATNPPSSDWISNAAWENNAYQCK